MFETSDPGTAPTLEAVAAAAGVSRSTASRVINGAQRVAPKTRAAVKLAIDELGYLPNLAARSLVTRRTGSIALVMPESNNRVLTDPFFGTALRGIGAVLSAAKMQLVVLIAPEEEGSQSIANYLQGGHVDGAIVVSHHQENGFERDLVKSRVPAVFIGRPFYDLEGVEYIDVDNTGGARLATEHLIKRGAKRILTIAGPVEMTVTQDRLTGYHQAMDAAGLSTEGRVSYGDFTVAGGAQAMRELLEKNPDVDGVFAASDQMALGALQVLNSAGRQVPDDVLLIGFDNLGVADSTLPKLTTVHNPVLEMATEVTEHLVARVLGQPSDWTSTMKILEPTLVDGDSA